MKQMHNNRDLYNYLLSLASILEQGGADSLSQAVAFASKQAASFSTEFLGESRIVLRKVRDDEAGVLSEEDRGDLLDVVRQLDQALDAR